MPLPKKLNICSPYLNDPDFIIPYANDSEDSDFSQVDGFMVGIRRGLPKVQMVFIGHCNLGMADAS